MQMKEWIFNEKDELEGLATAIKEVYFQDYNTTAYHDSEIEIDKLHFDYLI